MNLPQVNANREGKQRSRSAFPLPFEDRALVAKGSLAGQSQPEEYAENGGGTRYRRGSPSGKNYHRQHQRKGRDPHDGQPEVPHGSDDLHGRKYAVSVIRRDNASWRSGPIGAVLRALGVAARSLAHAAGLESATLPRSLTGVDYLAPITHRHRCDLFARLRLGDPANVAMAGPWDQVVMVTAGRLLISAMA